MSSAWEGLPTVVIESLAEAILATLDEPPRRDLLRRRARHFSTDGMIGRYPDLLPGERP